MSSGIKPLDVLRAERCRLREWWEIAGVLRGTRVNGLEYDVFVECDERLYRLVYPVESKEAEILGEKLRGLEGRVIGILRTDLSDMPVAVRVEE